jgi:hypothetical protein
MILTVTDFGLGPPYLAQMKAAVLTRAPQAVVLDLFADLPAYRPQGAAYLLAAYAGDFPRGSVFLCVVDPGVGTTRGAVAVEADGRWFVAPDNGLTAIVARRAAHLRVWRIDWRPARLSDSFHGRDLFAPVAAQLWTDAEAPGPAIDPADLVGAEWPEQLAEIVYCDAYGNAMTGLDAGGLDPDAVLEAAGRRLPYARTFGEVPVGAAFWYANANGLAEIAVNQGSAARDLGLGPGTPVTLHAAGA